MLDTSSFIQKRLIHIETGLQIRVSIGKLFSYFSSKTYVVGTQKEPSQRDGSFEHPKHMFKLMGEKIISILRS